MKRGSWFKLVLTLFTAIGLAACQIEQNIKPQIMNKDLPDPNKFGLGVASARSLEEITTCLRNNLSSNHIAIIKYIENLYPKHRVFEYHLKGYSEILRVVDRNNKRQIFFIYDPEKSKHKVIFDIVNQCYTVL